MKSMFSYIGYQPYRLPQAIPTLYGLL